MSLERTRDLCLQIGQFVLAPSATDEELVQLVLLGASDPAHPGGLPPHPHGGLGRRLASWVVYHAWEAARLERRLLLWQS